MDRQCELAGTEPASEAALQPMKGYSIEGLNIREVLQQMESFGGVFVGTTNFGDRLDSAAARRFTFKVELDYLDQDGVRVFWKRYFGAESEEDVRRRLAQMDRLTPGDFRTVRQELFYLGDDVNDGDRLEALEAELAAKTKKYMRPIGFAA